MAFDLVQLKKAFFDRKAIVDQVDAGKRRVASKWGAFVRTRARSSIRKRKAVSEPGQPPSSHVGLLKKFIFFAWDASTDGVVIGPTIAGSGSGAPESLEEGGSAVIRERVLGRITSRKVTIRPRPFMKPAFDAELNKIDGDLKNLMR